MSAYKSAVSTPFIPNQPVGAIHESPVAKAYEDAMMIRVVEDADPYCLPTRAGFFYFVVADGVDMY